MLTAPAYAPYLIKEYPHWLLFLNKKQAPYLGRCYAWWKDREPGEGEGMRPSALPPEALVELHHRIFDDVLDACRALGHDTDAYGKSFLLNMAYLANEGHLHAHHMHWHFVPRFTRPLHLPRIGVRVEDTGWGSHYARAVQDEHELGESRLRYIRAVMAKAISGIADPQP